jgi:hypothetical protein
MKIFILLFTALSLEAFEVLLGINTPIRTVYVHSKGSSDQIVTMEGNPTLEPSLHLRSETNYFNQSNWGYFLSYNFDKYKINRQKDLNGDIRNYGTSIEGKNIFFTPNLHYHFSRNSKGWNKKFGMGIGVGILSLKGSFKSLEAYQSETEQVNITKLGYTIDVFYEFSKKNHFITIQANSTNVSGDKYDYEYQTGGMMYHYRFNF